MSAKIQDLTDEQFELWVKMMIDEAGRRGIPVKGTDNIHWKRVSKGNVGALIKLRAKIGELNQNDVHIANDLDLSYSERANFSTLRQHGLVAHVKDREGKRISGRWLITTRGAKFLAGKIAIPNRVAVMNNRVIDRATDFEDQVKIHQVVNTAPVFDDVWDYRANMDASAVPKSQSTLL